MRRNWLILITACMTLLTACTSNKTNQSFDKNISKYSKSITETFNYDINNNKLIIISEKSNLEIKKEPVKNVEVKLLKSVGGNVENGLDKGIESINCNLEENTITISADIDKDLGINSINISTQITIPNNINELEISNKCGSIEISGDYDALEVNAETGKIKYDGILKYADINSKIGAIKFKFKEILPEYVYKFSGDTGRVDIQLPKKAQVNLDEVNAMKVNLKGDVQESSEGYKLYINRPEDVVNITDK